jgi:hypothetical protein
MKYFLRAYGRADGCLEEDGRDMRENVNVFYFEISTNVLCWVLFTWLMLIERSASLSIGCSFQVSSGNFLKHVKLHFFIKYVFPL